jgi:CRP-like cAMP-binding protein
MSTSAPPKQARNRLLDRLPRSEYKALLGSQENIVLASGEEVYRQTGTLRHVYFPTSGMISLTVRMEDGTEVEAATIGNEGLVGLPVALGLDFSPIRAIAQIPGGGVRIPAAVFLEAMKPGGTLDHLVRRYAAYSLRYANQTIACNLLHSAEQRVCRWLLMSEDRAGKDEFSLTHKFLAEMLGVRRQTVTVIARVLQKRGMIKYQRGMLRILHREKLEACSCECYAVTATFYDRIMEDLEPRRGSV